MAQVSSCLRRVEGGYAHWCPGCNRLHVIPDNWNFDGDLVRPTFSPSVRITYNGPDAGEVHDGYHLPARCCHYFLTIGELKFCSDSTHALSGKSTHLPLLPGDYCD